MNSRVNEEDEEVNVTYVDQGDSFSIKKIPSMVHEAEDDWL